MAATAVVLPIPKGQRLGFEVFRNGRKIGEQNLHFTRSGTALTVHNQVNLRVTLLDIPVFHYSGHITEHWRDSEFQKAESAINDNGTEHRLLVERQSGGIAVSGNHTKHYMAPPDALPLTYWNKAMLKGPMINMQTGHTDEPTVTSKGWFKLPTAAGGSVTAEQYKLSGSLDISVYYDRNNQWEGIAFNHSGHITYRPMS